MGDLFIENFRGIRNLTPVADVVSSGTISAVTCQNVELRNTENRCNPEQPQPAEADERDQPRQHGIAGSPQRADHHVHHTAKNIRPHHVGKARNAGADNFRTGCIQLQKDFRRQKHEAAQSQSRDGDTELPGNRNAADAREISCAVILAYKRDRGLVKCVHRQVDKAFDVHGGGITRNNHGAERVHRRLDHNIRERKHSDTTIVKLRI